MNSIEKKFFGKLSNGEDVYQHILHNEKIEIEILNYGGIIKKIICCDGSGKKDNIILSYDCIKAYEEDNYYFGGIIGPVAGRIGNGTFSLDGENYFLDKNNNSCCLHGGKRGFNKVLWEVVPEERNDSSILNLHYFKKDGEGGFPGNVDVYVKYILEGNEFKIEFFAETDRKTILNLTSHCYFNLDQSSGNDVLDHKLFLNADHILEIDAFGMVTGEKIFIKGTNFDFSKMKKIREAIDFTSIQIRNAKGLDHPYILKENSKPAAILEEEHSGRKIEIYTDNSSAVIYTSNFLEEKMHCAICIEPQEIPDDIHISCGENTIIEQGKPYYKNIKFKIL